MYKEFYRIFFSPVQSLLPKLTLRWPFHVWRHSQTRPQKGVVNHMAALSVGLDDINWNRLVYPQKYEEVYLDLGLQMTCAFLCLLRKAFQLYYRAFVEASCPTEDIYLE